MQRLKNWHESKTKLGIALIAICPVLMALGEALTNQVDWLTTINTLVPLVGGVWAAFGVRDLPIINAAK